MEVHVPPVRIVALLSKAGSYGCTLFLHDSSLVGDRLGRSHVADELLDCTAAR